MTDVTHKLKSFVNWVSVEQLPSLDVGVGLERGRK